MLKALWMTDPHFTAQGLLRGLNTRTRLSAAIGHMNEHHSDAEFCIISGDLVNQTTQADYMALKAHFDELKISYFPMIGNDDDRELLRSTLPLPQNCMEKFIQYSVSSAEGLMVCLDTQKAGETAGEFCQKRLDWLKQTLDATKTMPVFVFMHHHPQNLGLPMLDPIKNQNGDELLDLLTQYDNVKYLFIGHVHRALSGTMRGIGFSTMNAISFQAPAPVPSWTWDDFRPAEEPSAYGVMHIENGDVNIQYTQYCKYDFGMETK